MSGNEEKILCEMCKYWKYRYTIVGYIDNIDYLFGKCEILNVLKRNDRICSTRKKFEAFQ